MQTYKELFLQELFKDILSFYVEIGSVIFVFDHFSHNGINVIYDELKIVGDKRFVTSYDGLIIDF